MSRKIQYYIFSLIVVGSCQSSKTEESRFLTEEQLTKYKYYPGLISTDNLDENSISFSSDGTWAFWTAGTEWDQQLPFLAKRVDDQYQSPKQLVALDTIYNGAISPSGLQILYSIRDEDETSTWLSQFREGQWQVGINLTEKWGIEVGYFHWYSEKEVYFYSPENNGDLAHGIFENDTFSITPLPATINTVEGTEFSPFVTPGKQLLIFTRYLDNDPTQQGFFYSKNVSKNEKPIWDKPKKIEVLPYGWGALISQDEEAFFFTDGLDIFALPYQLIDIGSK